jgi:hypothetical protein
MDEPVLNSDIPDDASSDDDSNSFEVERIVGYDSGDDEPQYQVRWKGYSKADDTWEPLSALGNAKKALNAFHHQWNIQNPDMPQFLVEGRAECKDV